MLTHFVPDLKTAQANKNHPVLKYILEKMTVYVVILGIFKMKKLVNTKGSQLTNNPVV